MTPIWKYLVITILLHAYLDSKSFFVSSEPSPGSNDSENSIPQYVTQTVYGFLDFTTTIGNTVMVFSPHSAGPKEPPNTPVTIANVIETKADSFNAKVNDIQPTKTITEKKSNKVQSVVHVVAGSQPATNDPFNLIQSSASSATVVLPKSSPPLTSVNVNPLQPDKGKIFSKVEVVKSSPTKSLEDVIAIKENRAPSSVINGPQVISTIVQVQSETVSSVDEPHQEIQVGYNEAEPEYDFLSRQPSEFAEETYRIVNLKPSARHHSKPKQTQTVRKENPSKSGHHPTGLVTKLSGTVVKDGVTTVHETSVVGTYISGKYAQVLQSSSHVIKNANNNNNNGGGSNKGKISPSSTLRILKTASPTTPHSHHHNIDPTPSGSDSDDVAPQPVDSFSGPGSPNHVRSSRRPSTSSGNFKNRFRNGSSNNKGHKDETSPSESRSSSSSSNTSSSTSYGTTKKSRHRSKPKNRRQKGSRQSSSASKVVNTPAVTATEAFARRGFKPKIQSTNVELEQPTSLYKFKLNRTPGRWQYKTSPKPRVTIRKAEPDENTSPSSTAEPTTNEIPSISSKGDTNDLESLGSINSAQLSDLDKPNNKGQEKKYHIETLNVEISTPGNFKDTYYEIATIKTPYTFQVGTVKNTRYITVTSTFEKSLEPEPTYYPSTLPGPLTENILAPSMNVETERNILESSIATLPPLYLSSDAATPTLETKTETFTTTQNILKTHILPIIKEGENASSLTLIQTYQITKFVTATKTLPPSEAFQFVPAKQLKEFNKKLDEAGSELHLELEFGDDNDEDEEEAIVRRLPPDLDLINIGTADLEDHNSQRQQSQKNSSPTSNDDKLRDGNKSPTSQSKSSPSDFTDLSNQQNLSPEQMQQLALLRLLNPAAQLPQVITTSKPVIKLENVYTTHVIPVVKGQSTSYSTISKLIGTVSKTEFELGTSTIAPAPLPIPQIPVNPLFAPQPHPQFQITTAPIVTQTMITEVQSKILKLTFGAKTAYTTLFSTNVVPTILTTYITTSVPVQPSAAFPGFFAPPYNPYPFVG